MKVKTRKKRKVKPRRKKRAVVKKPPEPTIEEMAMALAYDKGIKPYNAAVTLGMSPVKALEFASSAMVTAMSPNTPLDIAERMMITPRDLIVHLAGRAGLDGTGAGAKKIVSAVQDKEKAMDFIEVDDYRTQLAYLKELLAFLYEAKEEAAGIAGSKPIFNIQFNVLPENATPDQADNIIELSAG